MSNQILTNEALQSVVAELGFELVDAVTSGPERDRLVRIRIDRPGGAATGAGVTTEDCALVSREIERRLAAAETAGSVWRLEVSSPGIERPIRFVEHWRRFVGHEVRLRAAVFRGRQVARIVAVPDDQHVEVEVSGVRHVVPLEAVREATLVVDWSAT